MCNKQRNQLLKDHVIFTMSNASMHGLIHVVRSKRLLFERFLWIGLVVGAFSIATHQALLAWNRYETSPVVIIMEKDFFHWYLEYPSIFICFRELPPNAYKYMTSFKTKYNISASIEELENYASDLLFTNYETYWMLEKYANGSQKDLIPTDLYLELVNFTSFRTKKNFEGKSKSIFYTTWPKNIKGQYSFVLTEFGFCHCFNSKLINYFNIENFIKGTKDEFEFQSINRSFREPPLSLKQSDLYQKSFMFVTSTNELIDITSQYFTTTKSSMGNIFLDLVDIKSDKDIIGLLPKQRNCKFTNEAGSLKYSPIYSYNLCRIECRIKLCLKFCHCTPYYYKRKNEELICNMTGMYCLSKHPEIVTLSDPQTEKNLCPCLQNCDSQRITVEYVVSNKWSFGPSITVKSDLFPKTRYRRTLIFTKTDLLVQVGSLFGLFLGCSVLSLIEIPYFLTLRFFWGVFGYKRIKPNV